MALDRMRVIGCAKLDGFPLVPATPLVARMQVWRIELELVAHGEGDIWFPVAQAGDESDGSARDDLTDEDHPTARANGGFAADIEAEIDLVKVGMEGDRQSEDAGVQEAEPDDAEESPAIVEIQVSAGWDERLYKRRVGDEVQHSQVTPVCGEEWAGSHVNLWEVEQAPRPRAAEIRKR